MSGTQGYGSNFHLRPRLIRSAAGLKVIFYSWLNDKDTKHPIPAQKGLGGLFKIQKCQIQIQ